MVDLLEHLLRPGLRGAGRQLHQREQRALVLFRQETGGDLAEDESDHRHQHRVAGHVAPAAAQHVLHDALVAAIAAIEGAVERAEEAGRGQRMALGHRLEQGRAQRRRQDHRHQHRQRHRRHDGHGELAVDHAGRAAEEGHRHEDRRQHQRHADQRAGDLPHRLARRLQRRQAFLAHHALDVLDDDDRVVDQQADGQHHRQHRQRVERVAEHRQHAEGAHQHHRHRDRRDQRGAEVLQEQVHDQEDQHHGLDQRLDHLLDGDAHERRRVVGLDHLDAGREELAELVELRIDALDRVERVRAGRQLDRQARRRLAVEVRDRGVALAAQLDARHVAQPHRRAVRLRAQQDGLEFLGRLQPRLRGDGRVELLARHRRQAAELAGRDLRVLRLHRGLHIQRRQLEAVELARIQPDAHRVLRAEQRRVAHAFHAADRVLHVGRDVVRQVGPGEPAVLRDEGQHIQEVVGRLGDLNALLLDLLRQQRGRQRQLVLDLHLRGVGIGAGLEGQGDGHAAGRFAGRGDVREPVQPLHLLLDDLRDGVLQGLGGGAGIVRRDGDGGRGDGGVLRDRQGQHRHGAGQHRDDGQDPGEDRTVDEEASHEGLRPMLNAQSRCWPRRSSRRRARTARPPP